MADVTVAAGEVSSGRITLVAATVSTVTFADNVKGVRVINTDTSATVYYSVDASTPTVDGKRTYEVPPSSVSEEQSNVDTDVIKLISAGTPTVRVEKV